jgi:flagellar assembly protein FliH
MTEPAKYLFDRQFDGGERQKEVHASLEKELQTQFDCQLEHERGQAFDDGRKEGRDSALQSLDANISATLDKVLGLASDSTQIINEKCASIRSDALHVAVTAADKLASSLLGKDPAKALENLFGECIELVSDAPHIAIRVNDEMAEHIQTRVNEMALQKGFAGEILVVPDPEIAPGDGQLDWADGGASRSYDEIRQQIDAAVNRYLEVHDSDRVASQSQARRDEMKAAEAPADADSDTEGTLEFGETA